MNKEILSNTGFTRFVTTKSGTHIIWYDGASKRQRRINLSKVSNRQYFGISSFSHQR